MDKLCYGASGLLCVAKRHAGPISKSCIDLVVDIVTGRAGEDVHVTSLDDKFHCTNTHLR